MAKKSILGSAGEPYLIEVALGQVDGVELDNKFGRNASVGTSFENVNDQGGTYTYTTSETSLYISSSSASDDDQIVTVQYLDEELTLKNVQVSLSGQTKTLVCSDFFRLMRASVSAGSSTVGDLYLYEDDTLTGGVPDTSTNIRGKVLVGNNQTQMAKMTVPSNCVALILGFTFTCGKDNEVQIVARIRPADGSAPWRKVYDHDTYREPLTEPPIIPRIVPTGYDVEILAMASSGTASVSANWSYLRNYNISDE